MKNTQVRFLGKSMIILTLVSSLFAMACSDDDKKDDGGSKSFPPATAQEVQSSLQEVLGICKTVLDPGSTCANEFFQWKSADECTSKITVWDMKNPAKCSLEIPESAYNWAALGLENYCNSEQKAYYDCLKEHHCSSMDMMDCMEIETAVNNCFAPYIQEHLDKICPKQSVSANCSMNNAGKLICDYSCSGTWKECYLEVGIERSGVLPTRGIMMECEDGVLKSQVSCGNNTVCNDMYTDCGSNP